MTKERKQLVLAFIVTTLIGSCLHFLYTFWPNVVTAVIAPVNESVWEHVKLVYWPLLVAGCIMVRRQGNLGGWMLSLLIGAVGVLVLGCVYCIMLGGEAMAVMVGIYVLMMAVGFFLPAPLDKKLKGRWGELFLLLVIALGVGIVMFTFLPPDHILYADLAGQNTWAVIPY